MLRIHSQISRKLHEKFQFFNIESFRCVQKNANHHKVKFEFAIFLRFAVDFLQCDFHVIFMFLYLFLEQSRYTSTNSLLTVLSRMIYLPGITNWLLWIEKVPTSPTVSIFMFSNTSSVVASITNLAFT